MNNREKGYIKEKIKTIILVVLFLQTILLLYFFWQDVTLRDIRINNILALGDNTAETIAPEELIIPSHIDVCLDNDTYTRMDGDAAACWGAYNEGDEGSSLTMLACVTGAMSTGDEFIEEITRSQYEEVMGMLSARAVFNYYLPYREYCTLLGISNPPGTEMIEAVREIGFSAGSAESMFIYDGAKNKYYRIVSDFDAEPFLNELQSRAAGGNTTYYPLESFLGSDFTSGVLIPQFMETDIAEGSAYRELGHDTAAEIADAGTEFARTFFSNTFDFVRRVEEENGRITYIYGYGEKILTIYENGEIEYKADISEGTDAGYMSALRTALSTVAELGGFETTNGNEFTPYLSYAQVKNEPGQTEKAYRFEFGMLIDGEKVHFERMNVAVVEVYGGQISYFSRNYIETSEETYRGEMREAYSAINVLAQNYEYIYEVISGLESVADADIMPSGRLNSDERLEFVASLIDDMSIGYVFDEENSVLRPCYMIAFFDGDVKMYFDVDTAEPAGSSVNEAERLTYGLV